MEKETISRIVKRIAEDKCLVILGPELLYNNGESVNSKLAKFLQGKIGDQVKYYPDDEMFKFASARTAMLIEDDIQDFFSQFQPNELYRKIAELPFSTIINTAADKTLNKAFKEKNLECDYEYYQKGEAQKDYKRKHKTLIYNIFGDASDINSVVFTFDDLFDYLFSIMGDFELNIKSELRKARSVLFIGFNFDKWYFKLLLRILKINENKILYSPDISQEHSKNFYSAEFEVEFFGNNTAEEIISEIHNQASSEGILLAKPEIYVSYAWGGESEDFVNEMDKALEKNNLKITRDKRDLDYSKRISLFIERLGQGKCIVLVISEKYLKSNYCMDELLKIYETHEFEKRAIPIVLHDAKIFDSESLLAYLKYWKDEKERLDDLIRENLGGDITDLTKKRDLCILVIANWGPLMNTLKDMNLLSPEIHLQTEFEAVIRRILECRERSGLNN